MQITSSIIYWIRPPLFLRICFSLPRKALHEAHRTSWGIKAHSRCNLAFRFSRESWEVRQALLSRMDHTEKSKRIHVRVPWGPVFLADERREVGLNPPLGHSWAMWGRRVLMEGPRCSLEVLSGSWQQFTFQNVRWLFNFTPEGTKTRGDLPVAVTAAQTITEVGFWRRLTLLPSTDAFLPQTRSFW